MHRINGAVFVLFLALTAHAQQPNWEPLIWSAVSDGDHRYLRELIDCGAILEIKDNQGRTPYLLAFEEKNLAMMSFLLANHAPIDTRYANGDTPLMRAAQAGDLDVVMFLVQRGADLLLTNHAGHSAAELAKKAKQDIIARFLHDTTQAFAARPAHTIRALQKHLRKEVHRGVSKETLRTLLLNGPRLNDYHPFREAPILLKPAEKHRLKLVRVLLEAGANPQDYQNNMGPLDVLPRRTSPKLRELLISYGAIPQLSAYTRIKLLLATDANDIPKMKKHLDNLEGTVDYRREDGKTPLMHAAYYGHHEAMMLLIEHGAAINIATFDGWTPLLLSVYGGRETTAGLLLSMGANPRHRVYELTALHLAMLEGHDHLIPLLLDNGFPVDLPGPKGSTALIYAVLQGELGMASDLFAAGADPFWVNEEGESAFRIASRLEDNTMLHMLMADEAQLQPRDTTPTLTRQQQIHPHLRGNSSRWDQEFLWALSNGVEKSVLAFLERDYQINDYLENGWTPLMYAAAFDDPHMIRFLLEQGALIDKTTQKNRNTALMMAAMQGYVPALEALLAEGANLQRVNRSGHTAFTLAVVGGHVEAVKMLHAQGAQPSWHHLHESILSVPASKGDVTMLQVLHGMGIDPDSSNTHGWTPLMYAARAGHVEAAEFLLARKAAINRRNSEEWSALTFAVSSNRIEMVRLLLHRGARMARDQQELKLAISHGFHEVKKLLQASATSTQTRTGEL